MLAWHALTSGSCFIFPAIWAKTCNTGLYRHHHHFKNRRCVCHSLTFYLWNGNENCGTPESETDTCFDCTSLHSVKNLCSCCDAANICLRVSISSKRSAHDSFRPSFHSAMVAASVWPQSIISFTILLTCSKRCWPMLLVSEANLVNLSCSTWNINATQYNTQYFLCIFSILLCIQNSFIPICSK